MAMTGHKSEASIKCYAKKMSAKKCREISDLLDQNLSEEPPCKVAKTSTISKPTKVVNAINTPLLESTSEPEKLIENFGFDDDIPDNQIIDILIQIEKENFHCCQQTQTMRSITCLNSQQNKNQSISLMCQMC